MFRILYAVLAVAIVLTTVLAVGVVAAVRKPMPDTTGEVSLAGLAGEVVIQRDGHGIPHITADTPADLFFAQGYVHAQDRFHEMDVRRHVAAGRLTELIGHDGVAPDRLIRALKIPQRAQRDVRMLPTGTRQLVDAYARGINAYTVGRSGSSLGLEYIAKTLVGRDYRPEPWRLTDSVAWAGLLDWSLADGVAAEIDRVMIARHMAIDRVGELYPGIDMKQTVAAKDGKRFEHPSTVPPMLALREAVATVPRVTGIPAAAGTDAWASGRVLHARLASQVSIPGPWYQVGLHCRRVSAECPYDVSGLSLSGMPGVVVGRNRAFAWGLSPAPVPPASLDVVASRKRAKGPVVATLPSGHVVVLSWERLARRPSVTGLLALNRARSPDAVTAAAKRLRLPFALVHVDARGVPGRVPDGPAPVRMDERSRAAYLLVSELLALDLRSRFAEQGQQTLVGWDRRMTVGDPAPAYFAAVWRHLLARIFHDEVPWAQWPDGSARWIEVVGNLMAQPTSSWWDDLSTPQMVEERDDILKSAMIEARNDLTRIRARDVNEWDWGELHGPKLENPTLSGRLFERGPVPLAGSGDTAEATTWNPAIGYMTTAAPMAGITADLARPERSRWIQATGVSGHPFSGHYTDQVELWSRGGSVPWRWSRAARERAAEDVLRLSSPSR